MVAGMVRRLLPRGKGSLRFQIQGIKNTHIKKRRERPPRLLSILSSANVENREVGREVVLSASKRSAAIRTAQELSTPGIESSEVEVMRKMFDLTGKVAIVTGGNGGIGLGMARGLAENGANVAVLGRNLEKSQAAAKQIADELGVKTSAVVADVSQAADVDRAVAEIDRLFGRIDILINNAGINIRKAPEVLSLDEWRQVLDVNLTSAFMTSQAVYPHMKQAGAGKIINIGSMTSIFGAASRRRTRRAKAGSSN